MELIWVLCHTKVCPEAEKSQLHAATNDVWKLHVQNVSEGGGAEYLKLPYDEIKENMFIFAFLRVYR